MIKTPKKAKKETQQIQNPPCGTFKKTIKKTIIHEPHENINIYSDNEEIHAPEQVINKTVTVKRNWEGTPNYYPRSS